MKQPAKLMLIGGTSHVGKSTLGRRLAEALDWNYLSTDQLARHPGRPWKTGDHPVPEDVTEHYLKLSTPELLEAVELHYRRNVWPIVDAIVRSRLGNAFDLGLVFEGSAMLPDLISDAAYPRVRTVWLTLPHALIEERVRHSSDYGLRTPSERRLIDAFLERTLAMDNTLITRARARGQEVLASSAADLLEMLATQLRHREP